MTISDHDESSALPEDFGRVFEHLPGDEVADGILLMEGGITENEIDILHTPVLKTVGPEEFGFIIKVIPVIRPGTFDRHPGFVGKDDSGLGVQESGLDPDDAIRASEIENFFIRSPRKVFKKKARTDIEFVATKQIRVIEKGFFKAIDSDGLRVGGSDLFFFEVRKDEPCLFFGEAGARGSNVLVSKIEARRCQVFHHGGTDDF
jgi:hypothetical protein